MWFCVGYFCLGRPQFWARNPRLFDLCLTSVDYVRVCCSVDFCLPYFTGFFQTVFWLFDLLLEVELTEFDQAVLEVKICPLDKR